MYVSVLAGLVVAVNAFATPTVLGYDFVVNTQNSYTVDVDSDWNIAALSDSGSLDLDYTQTERISADNGGGNFDIYVTQTNGAKRVDGAASSNLSNGADTMKMDESSGKTTHPLDPSLMFPSFTMPQYGSIAESTGVFSSSAVDVNDTWTQTIVVTPYNETAHTVNISCTLVEWTSLNGHDVGKVHRTWTQPMHWYNSDGTEVYGDLNFTEDLWFAYSEKILVKSSLTGTGEMTLKGMQGQTRNDLEFSVTQVTTLQ
jgi:hypothetical protein